MGSVNEARETHGNRRNRIGPGHWWVAALAISVAASVGVLAVCAVKLTTFGGTAPAIIILSLIEIATGFLMFEGLLRFVTSQSVRMTAWDQRDAATAVLGFGIAAALLIGIVYADLGMMIVAVLAGLAALFVTARRRPRSSYRATLNPGGAGRGGGGIAPADTRPLRRLPRGVSPNIDVLASRLASRITSSIMSLRSSTGIDAQLGPATSVSSCGFSSPPTAT